MSVYRTIGPLVYSSNTVITRQKEILVFIHVLVHGVQRRMISVDNFFVFLRLLFFAVLLLYET